MSIALTNLFTLPNLQSHLDRMPVARTISLAKTDIERLFGLDDTTHRRLQRFARGHNCAVVHADGCIAFQKLPYGHRQIS
ncbi:MAG TPA: hypothetical protein VFR52_05170 [Sphingomicrobium sp.]|nr:hypothetical protein [Sphingomicrobium sp.]